jgi:hypothetical protein
MPGGRFDSSRTRVAPFFNFLFNRDPTGVSWLPKLLALPIGGSPLDQSEIGELKEHYWWPAERRLDAPPALLSWLVRNLQCPSSIKAEKLSPQRQALLAKEPARINEALDLLQRSPRPRAWYVMEGPTYPDAYLATDNVVIVIEGKRTEPGPTQSTTWMPVRHQMLRHIDAALGYAGPRALHGFFMIDGPEDGSIPSIWQNASRSTLDPEVIDKSLPHRNRKERRYIANSFLGVTTWQHACAELDVPPTVLPHEVAG